MQQNIGAAMIRHNKPEAFDWVKPLDHTGQWLRINLGYFRIVL